MFVVQLIRLSNWEAVPLSLEQVRVLWRLVGMWALNGGSCEYSVDLLLILPMLLYCDATL